MVAAGWPGFGAKVGGTIAMVPGFLLLMAAAAGVRITVRRGLLVAVSGLAVVVVFAALNYALPGTGHSDIGAFVGQVLHGGASGTLHRKVSSNLGSLTESVWSLVILVVVAVTGVAVCWPVRVRAWLLVRGYQAVPLLRPALSAIWLTWRARLVRRGLRRDRARCGVSAGRSRSRSPSCRRCRRVPRERARRR